MVKKVKKRAAPAADAAGQKDEDPNLASGEGASGVKKPLKKKRKASAVLRARFSPGWSPETRRRSKV